MYFILIIFWFLYSNKDKKGGAGKGNTGRYQDDLKGREKPEEDNQEDEETKDEEPQGITFDEYLANNQVDNKVRVNEAKAKITSEQLMKEAQESKASVLNSRNRNEIDERRQGKRKGRTTDENHHAVDTNGNLGNLLGKWQKVEV